MSYYVLTAWGCRLDLQRKGVVLMSYNGWTNYATWRVNLEIFDGMEPREFGRGLDKFDLADRLKDYVDEILTSDSMQWSGHDAGRLVLDYARAFVSDVDWREIAESMLDAYQDEENKEDEEEAA
jgi:hypothetical protein